MEVPGLNDSKARTSPAPRYPEHWSGKEDQQWKEIGRGPSEALEGFTLGLRSLTSGGDAFVGSWRHLLVERKGALAGRPLLRTPDGGGGSKTSGGRWVRRKEEGRRKMGKLRLCRGKRTRSHLLLREGGRSC